MRKRLVDEFITSVSNIVDQNILKILQEKLTICVDNYDVSVRETALVPQDYIPEAVKVYLVSRKIEGLAASTLSNYGSRLKAFFQDIRRPLEQIGANDIKVYLYRLQEKTGMGNRTLNSVRTVICTFFRWVTSEGYLEKDPSTTIKAIKYTVKDRGYLSEMELEKLRNACETIRDRAIVELSYSTGCRVSELVHLKKEDIDFATKTITLFGKGSKYRKSYINAKAEYALKKYFESRDDVSDYVIVKDRAPFNSLTRSMIQKRITYLGEKAGIAWRISPHTLRHTTASLGLQHGMAITEVQRMLGHASINTTLIYATITNQDVKASHAKCVI